MKFLWTTILVNNMEESLKFYQEFLELKLERRFSGAPGMEICFLGEGETKIELICNEKIKNINPGNAVTLGFKVDSLDKAVQSVNKRGIEIKTGPVQPNPHIRYFIIKDPNGVKIQFAEQLD